MLIKKNKRTIRMAACAAAVWLFCSACKFGGHEMFWRDNPVDQRSTSLTKLSPPSTLLDNGNEYVHEYDCLLIADSHFGNDHYTVPQEAFFASLDSRATKPKFCIMLGDIVDHGTADEYDQFARFQEAIQKRRIPVYNVVGNHDVYNSGWGLWKKTCPPHTSSFYFETAKLGWYFVDTASGTLGRPQFYDLKAKLHNSTKPKCIFTHYPLYGNNIFYFSLSNPRERAELISTFAKTNLKLYCSGHYHTGKYYDYGPFEEYTVAALGQYGAYHILHVNEDTLTFRITTVNLR